MVDLHVEYSANAIVCKLCNEKFTSDLVRGRQAVYCKRCAKLRVLEYKKIKKRLDKEYKEKVMIILKKFDIEVEIWNEINIQQ